MCQSSEVFTFHATSLHIHTSLLYSVTVLLLFHHQKFRIRPLSYPSPRLRLHSKYYPRNSQVSVIASYAPAGHI